MRPVGHGTNRRRSGQAVVEFALVLPLFMLLLLASVEFGRAYFDLHLLTSAAREGARVGSLPGSLEDDVSDAVDEFLQGVGLSGNWTTVVTVTTPDSIPRAGGLAEAEEGDRVAVEVTYDFSVLAGTIIPGFRGVVPMRGRCVFRHE